MFCQDCFVWGFSVCFPNDFHRFDMLSSFDTIGEPELTCFRLFMYVLHVGNLVVFCHI